MGAWGARGTGCTRGAENRHIHTHACMHIHALTRGCTVDARPLLANCIPTSPLIPAIPLPQAIRHLDECFVSCDAINWSIGAFKGDWTTHSGQLQQQLSGAAAAAVAPSGGSGPLHCSAVSPAGGYGAGYQQDGRDAEEGGVEGMEEDSGDEMGEGDQMPDARMAVEALLEKCSHRCVFGGEGGVCLAGFLLTRCYSVCGLEGPPAMHVTAVGQGTILSVVSCVSCAHQAWTTLCCFLALVTVLTTLHQPSLLCTAFHDSHLFSTANLVNLNHQTARSFVSPHPSLIVASSPLHLPTPQ